MRTCSSCYSSTTGIILLICCIGLVWAACALLQMTMEEASPAPPTHIRGSDKDYDTWHVFRDLPERESMEHFKHRVWKQADHLNDTYEIVKILYRKRDPSPGKPYIAFAVIYYRDKGE